MLRSESKTRLNRPMNILKHYPPPAVLRGPARVAELMEIAQQELDYLSVLTILTVSSPTGTKVAEYLQGLLEQKLGLKTVIDQQSFKQYLSKVQRGEFDLAMSSWYPDFDDLVTYADLLASYNANNRGRYVNLEYDK